MQQPEQQRLEPQTLQTKQASATARTRQAFPMEPNPHVAQNQCQGDEEKSHHRVARAGFDACLVQLAVTGLDAEAGAIRVFHPTGRAWLDSPVGIDPGKTSAVFPFAATVATMQPDRDGSCFIAG